MPKYNDRSAGTKQKPIEVSIFWPKIEFFPLLNDTAESNLSSLDFYKQKLQIIVGLHSLMRALLKQEINKRKDCYGDEICCHRRSGAPDRQ